MTLYDFKYRANRTIRTIHQGGLFMNAKQKLHQAHLNEWAARISDQKACGLTVRQWCAQITSPSINTMLEAFTEGRSCHPDASRDDLAFNRFI